MKFFEGNLRNAISKRKTFSSAFIVFVESKDEESKRFRQLLDEENVIPVKEYIAFHISPPSESYKYFLSIYHEVPVPSVFIIGNDGKPIRILSSFESKENFYANIKQALDIHKADTLANRKTDRLHNVNIVQILLKLPGGETAVVEFPEQSYLKEVKAFVKDSLVKKNFEMITPFPRKVFSTDEGDRTLVELQLNPTSTILIVPTEKCKSWTPQFLSNFFGVLVLNITHMLRNIKEWFFRILPQRRS